MLRAQEEEPAEEKKESSEAGGKVGEQLCPGSQMKPSGSRERSIWAVILAG